MMTERDAVDLITLAEARGIHLFLDGGWGVDALLGDQTRDHQDMDVFIEERQRDEFVSLLHEKGFKERKEAYSSPHHTVFGDAEGRIVDVHVFTYGPDRCLLFEGEAYPADTFSGEGLIGHKAVRCIPPAMQVGFHRGYAFDADDVHDVTLLCQRFHIPVPAEYIPFINGDHREETSSEPGPSLP